jgi:glucose/arabinose dehydrogenase
MKVGGLVWLVGSLALGTPVLAVQLEKMADGLTKPTAIAHGSDGSGRLFIAEQAGTVRVFEHGSIQAEPFLDIRDRVTKIESGCCDERGLLGLAFPRNFATSSHFYVLYTDAENSVVISRFSAKSGLADAASETVILKVPHEFENHFGGQLAFSPLDGQLYIGLGDGAGGNDPLNSGQDPDQLFAKILRIDVDNGSTTPEVVAMGLRNPWRFSFDRATGDMYIGDVGENDYEEINLRVSDTVGIINYGWPIHEGEACRPDRPCGSTEMLLPVMHYDHSLGCSVIGGYMYRGSKLSELENSYVFADFCSGRLWNMRWQPNEWVSSLLIERMEVLVSTFGEDEDGELYVVDFRRGGLYRLASGAAPAQTEAARKRDAAPLPRTPASRLGRAPSAPTPRPARSARPAAR